MLGLLAREGYEITTCQEDAEIIVVNTCGFIDSAKQESIDTILEMAQQKVSGSCRRLIVAGCLVERYRSEILAQIPEVDAVVGTSEIPQILDVCGELSEAGPPPHYESRELYLYSDSDPRILTTPGYSAYIKIAEGCDHPCSFCVIPKMRGGFRSRSIESTLREATRLASQGIKELNLIGQDTTMYGWDLGNRGGLAELIKRLGEVEGIEWIRVLYVYPNNICDEFLEAVAETATACKYIDVPLQHASRKILQRMKRGGNRRSLSNLIRRIRSTVPGVTIRTTMIVGFPGETEEDMEELMGFVEEMRFDRLGVFTYSDEEDATAYQLDSKLSEDVKNDRRRRLMELQAGISKRKNRELVGKVFPVLVEGVSPESELLWEGRLPSQAPEIDGVVYLTDGITNKVKPGDICPVRITEAHQYDLIGTVLP
ncbi:30S ribosomal protein S12 methylthiotransferase RimO [Acidobacteria bacterium AH-259-D05]|nr:30S ribosomal protein S12 methylthiotransferase RimO [Acidobacteria bacterium AH-259-D05]